MEAFMSIKRAAGLAFAVTMAFGLALPAQAAMPTGALVPPPGGFILFCARHMQECSGAVARPTSVELTAERRDQLDEVQARVNAAIQYRDDPQHVWDYPTNGTGDCNKYALEKRRELIEMGWPRDALLLTTAMTEHDEAHLVLVVRTSAGDLVLDSRLAPVVDWRRLPYRWLAQQSPESPALWVNVLPAGVATADASATDGRVATR
jgi:predicted transglutaminase-like cysteine proteinase